MSRKLGGSGVGSGVLRKTSPEEISALVVMGSGPYVSQTPNPRKPHPKAEMMTMGPPAPAVLLYEHLMEGLQILLVGLGLA
jgi:hypothetical protein